jgi:DNA-binding transcriptional MerR regulator
MGDIFMLIGSFECNIFVLNPAFNRNNYFLASLQSILFMETRILTLFDDDFFPPEPPKEKPKKEKASKPSTADDSAESDGLKKDTDIIAEALNEFHQMESKENVSIEKTDEKSVAPNTINDTETAVENEPEIQANAPLREEENPVEIEADVNEKFEITTSVDLDISDETTIDNFDSYHESLSAPVFEPAAIIPAEPLEDYNQEPVIFEGDIVEETEHEPASMDNDSAVNFEITTGVDLNIADESNIEVNGLNAETSDAPAFQPETFTQTASIEEEENADEDDIIASMEDEMDAVDVPVIDEAIVDDTLAESAPSTQDKELDKQILSELIQLDYAALMQKDYAFDLNNATVINKELPKRKPQQEKVIAYKNEEDEDDEEEVFEDVTPLPEWNLDKKYYTIGEVAALFEVNTSHIRFWTNEFKLRPRTTRKGDRLYSPKDIAELRLIHHLVKVKKHTIKGAREKLKAEKSDVNNKLDLKESLVQLKDTLLKIREQL